MSSVSSRAAFERVSSAVTALTGAGGAGFVAVAAVPHVFCVTGFMAATIAAGFGASAAEWVRMGTIGLAVLGTGASAAILGRRLMQPKAHPRHIDNRPWIKRMGPVFGLAVGLGVGGGVLVNSYLERGMVPASAEQMEIYNSGGFLETLDAIYRNVCGGPR